ncbi:MAG: hypothetical protein JXA71_01925 [Chitinispirillaceae bacterium]|nr:hypothetical protein [Chitinispirillaceae bacterium]
MRSIITVPFRLIWGIAGTVVKVIGLLFSFSFKGMRFAGGRFFAVLVAGIIGFFLGKKYIAGKGDQGK